MASDIDKALSNLMKRRFDKENRELILEELQELIKSASGPSTLAKVMRYIKGAMEEVPRRKPY